MYKSLFIYYEHMEKNVLLELFDKKIKFALPSSKSLDTYITKEIIPKLNDKAFDILYIKDSLSSNYLELFGVRLAYHVRLSSELGDIRFVPIVILSDVDTHILNRIDPMASVLFTQNIFTVQYKKESIETFKKDFTPKAMMDEAYKHFLNHIKMEAPRESQHDIANEWTIDQWSQALDVSSDNIKENKEKIVSMLYFKYLKSMQLYGEANVGDYTDKPTSGQGKILYIDDEWKKGWSDVMKGLFSDAQEINLEPFEYDYKDNNKFKMISSIKKKVQEYLPDVIVLDLRLAENDHKYRGDIGSYTGIEVLKQIKEINPGMQVIMLTATSQSVILEKLYAYGILGYVKKVHPEDATPANDAIDKLKTLVLDGLEKKYLKETWDIQENILGLQAFGKDEFYEIKFEVNSIFQVLDSPLDNKYIYAMLAIFKILELINNLFIEENFEEYEKKKYKYAFWKNSNKKIMTLNWDKLENVSEKGYNLSVEIKIRNILYKLGMTDSTLNQRIKQIVCSRNYAIHPEEKKHCQNSTVKQVTKKEILEWFKMLQTVLYKIDEKLT